MPLPARISHCLFFFFWTVVGFVFSWNISHLYYTISFFTSYLVLYTTVCTVHIYVYKTHLYYLHFTPTLCRFQMYMYSKLYIYMYIFFFTLGVQIKWAKKDFIYLPLYLSISIALLSLFVFHLFFSHKHNVRMNSTEKYFFFRKMEKIA